MYNYVQHNITFMQTGGGTCMGSKSMEYTLLFLQAHTEVINACMCHMHAHMHCMTLTTSSVQTG